MPRRKWSGLQFAAVNLWCSRVLPPAEAPRPLTTAGGGHLLLRTIVAHDVDRLEELQNTLRPGKSFTAWRKWVYRRAGSKLVWVLEDSSGGLVGCNMYYFREGEWRQSVVHTALTGVVNEYRGQGLGTAMRAAAVQYFTRGGLAGISTQIDDDNLASLRSAEHVGFRRTGQRDGRPLLFKPLVGQEADPV